jgi:protein SCO1/2
MQKREFLRRLISVCTVSGVLGALSGCSQSKPSFSAIDITGVDYARNFELIDQNGQLRHLTDFAGKVVVMFFGYTQCPDYCPTTMTELVEVKKALGKDADRLQVLFVTVDPERDTQEVLKAYVTNFDPSFLGLWTTAEKLAALAKDYRVYYNKVDGQTPTSYTVDHTAGSYVYDTRGRLRLLTHYGSGAQAVANDIALLLKERA